jgi:nuclear transport factor 2 (NTF2) superfamily protein
MAEDSWNSRDPEKTALGYSLDSRWRNRAEFASGRAPILDRKFHWPWGRRPDDHPGLSDLGL